jgi:hypothetical protein
MTTVAITGLPTVTSGLAADVFPIVQNGVTSKITNANLFNSIPKATIEGLTVGLGSGAAASNTAVGVSVLASNTTGDNNTAVGIHAAKDNLTGNGNTVIGSSALRSATAVTGAVALGNSALGTSSAGNYNTALGTAAGYSSYGGNNTYVGYRSGYGMTNGTNNVILGSYEGAITPIGGTGTGWIVLSNGAGAVQGAIDSAGVTTFPRGPVVVYAPDPTTISAVATLTNANIQTQIINTTGTTYTVTMPTQTTLNSLVSVWVGSYNTGYDFYVINTASGTITMAGNTGVTTLGTMTIATGVSAHFRIRRTLSSGYILYRMS